MTVEPIALSPWPLGQDAYHAETHPVFQVQEGRPIRLAEAVNCDLDDAGRPTPRVGTTLRAVLGSGKSLTSFGSYFYVQDGGTIKRFDPSDNWAESTLVSGLSTSARVVFHPHAQKLYYTNGVVCGAITSAGAASHWGLTVPPTPTLAETSGNLPAGRYLVSCTVQDSDGEESGCGKSALITLSSAGGFTVTLSATDSNATHVNVYVSSTNQEQLFWHSKVAVGSLPETVSSIDSVRGSTRPLRTQHMRGPIPADGIFSFLGYVLLFRDNIIFRNNGLSPSLFYPRQHVQVFPDNILAGAGTEGGFWVVTAKGAWFVERGSPEQWAPYKHSTREYAQGAAVVSGKLFPQLETNKLVAVFVSEDGLEVGLPTGQLVPITQDRLPLDVTDKVATFLVRDLSGSRQLVFTLNDA